MPKYTATCDSYGFRKKYWEEGQTVIVTAKEIKDHQELQLYFKAYQTEAEKETAELEQLQKDEEATEEAANEASDQEEELLLLTNDQLKEKLTNAGIEYPRIANKAQLIKLITEQA